MSHLIGGFLSRPPKSNLFIITLLMDPIEDVDRGGRLSIVRPVHIAGPHITSELSGDESDFEGLTRRLGTLDLNSSINLNRSEFNSISSEFNSISSGLNSISSGLNLIKSEVVDNKNDVSIESEINESDELSTESDTSTELSTSGSDTTDSESLSGLQSSDIETDETDTEETPAPFKPTTSMKALEFLALNEAILTTDDYSRKYLASLCIACARGGRRNCPPEFDPKEVEERFDGSLNGEGGVCVRMMCVIGHYLLYYGWCNHQRAPLRRTLLGTYSIKKTKKMIGGSHIWLYREMKYIGWVKWMILKQYGAMTFSTELANKIVAYFDLEPNLKPTNDDNPIEAALKCFGHK